MSAQTSLSGSLSARHHHGGNDEGAVARQVGATRSVPGLLGARPIDAANRNGLTRARVRERRLGVNAMPQAPGATALMGSTPRAPPRLKTVGVATRMNGSAPPLALARRIGSWPGPRARENVGSIESLSLTANDPPGVWQENVESVMMHKRHTLGGGSCDGAMTLMCRHFSWRPAAVAAHSSNKVMGANHDAPEPGDAQGSLK